jgi:long-chain fatty acid transport protein
MRRDKMSVFASAAMVLLVFGLLLPVSASATHGMNMEGYGPVALGMGGVSMAYDNGVAAVMNNPATLALMADGSSRLDIALGFLGPDVSAIVATPMGMLDASSSATLFTMPALGWARKQGALTYGLGIFGQGGMGTEFGPKSWLADPSQGSNSALTAGLVNRSEVSIGRFLVPVAYDVNDKLSIGGTIDLVWAGMDLQMAMSEAQFLDLANPQSQQAGRASGSLAQAFGMIYEPFGGTGVRKLHHAYFDFSNDNDFTGAAMGLGFSGKIGLVYQVSPELSIGATYHAGTALADLEADEATMRMAINMDLGMAMGGLPSGEYADMELPVSGEIVVENFQWPASLGAGVAYRMNEKILLGADVKWVNWSGVMENFNMSFIADQVPENGAFAGQQLDATLFQNWKDQTIIAGGGAYGVTDALELRAGFSLSANPVPDNYLNALFPAIVTDHVNLGVGYQIGESSSVDIAMSKGFEGEYTNPGNGTTVPPVTSTHGQLNAQLMYSFRF